MFAKILSLGSKVAVFGVKLEILQATLTAGILIGMVAQSLIILVPRVAVLALGKAYLLIEKGII